MGENLQAVLRKRSGGKGIKWKLGKYNNASEFGSSKRGQGESRENRVNLTSQELGTLIRFRNPRRRTRQEREPFRSLGRRTKGPKNSGDRKKKDPSSVS